ncbi:MAG TPA: hypothetical protein VL172_01165 [Kofleriaceae bacterium]|jgi:hypothetical protein|nr:hypothetical protein [Kofleriaceae bacterium]
MRLVVVAALALAGCFNPSYPDGVACDPTGWCPPGQLCGPDNRCHHEIGDGGIDIPDADLPDADPLGMLQSIDIGPDVTIPVNGTHTFTVTGHYENGDQTITDFAIWSSTDNAVMFVDFMGVAHGEGVGSATASADYMGRVDTALVTVQ